MKVPSIGTLSFGAVGLAALVLIAIGRPGSHVPPPPPAPDGPAPSRVAFGGFTLTSDSVDLPIDDQQYPDGPHADVINANCTSCHSASMALTQPKLTADQWKATVTKMREVYRAPVEAGDVDSIVAYLLAMPGSACDARPKCRPCHRPTARAKPKSRAGLVWADRLGPKTPTLRYVEFMSTGRGSTAYGASVSAELGRRLTQSLTHISLVSEIIM